MIRWTRERIVQEIGQLHTEGAALHCRSAEKHYPGLVQAAARHFGTWRRAVEAAGIDYDRLRKYRRWDQDRIIKRIRELHATGNDLSWRFISTEVDPSLAYAAISPKGFGSWRAAIIAAGLNYDEVARYKYWDKERVLHEIQELQRAGKPLSVSDMESNNPRLLWAARRRFASWSNALDAAGVDLAGMQMHSLCSPPHESSIFDSPELSVTSP